MRNLAAFLFLLSAIVFSPQIHLAFAGNEAALDNAYRRWEQLERQGNYHEAIQYAEQAVRLEKEFEALQKELVRYYLNMLDNTLSRTDKFITRAPEMAQWFSKWNIF